MWRRFWQKKAQEVWDGIKGWQKGMAERNGRKGWHEGYEKLPPDPTLPRMGEKYNV